MDKLTILEIKAARIEDQYKLANVLQELNELRAVWRAHFGFGFTGVEEFAAKLKAVNVTLWDVEDEIRDCECRKDFGARFISLARSVYQTNDARAAIKSEINRLMGSPLREEKAYKPYRSEDAIEDRLPAGTGAEHTDDARKPVAGPVGDRQPIP